MSEDKKLSREEHLEEILEQTATLRRKIFQGGKSGWSSASDAAKLSENFSRLASLEVQILDKLYPISAHPQRPQKPVKGHVKLD
jgi:hypothetical protein